MVGIDPETDFTVRPWVKAGTDIGTLRDDEIILGSEGYIFLGLEEAKPGDKVIFYGREFTIAGVLEPTGIGIDDSGYVTLDAIYGMADLADENAMLQVDVEPGDISLVMVDVREGYARGDVATEISRIGGVSAISSRELMSTTVAQKLESLAPGMLLIGAGFWLVTVLMIGAIFSMVVNERRRELGLLQAIGATRRYIFRMVMLESLQLTFIGGAIGLIVGGVALLAFKGALATSLGIAFLWPSSLYLAVMVVSYLGLAVATGVLGALYPATIASRLEPYQAIRTGE
ncbi:MAG: ABC transporter permease [Thermoleophilia bacterium]